MYLCFWFDWLYFVFFLQLTAASSVKYIIIDTMQANIVCACRSLCVTLYGVND